MPKKILGFHFQEIPLEEAKNAVLAGDGDYGEVKAMLLQKVPELELRNAALAPKDRLTFAFGLPKGEVPEDQRRGICMAINKMLKKAGHQWKITYSSTKSLFISIPTIRRTYSKGTPPEVDGGKIFELRKSGMSAAKISEELNIPLKTARYLCYQKYAQKAGKSVPIPEHPYLSEADRKADHLRKKQDVMALKQKGLGVFDISRSLNINRETVKSIYYGRRKKGGSK